MSKEISIKLQCLARREIFWARWMLSCKWSSYLSLFLSILLIATPKQSLFINYPNLGIALSLISFLTCLIVALFARYNFSKIKHRLFIQDKNGESPLAYSAIQTILSIDTNQKPNSVELAFCENISPREIKNTLRQTAKTRETIVALFIFGGSLLILAGKSKISPKVSQNENVPQEQSVHQAPILLKPELTILAPTGKEKFNPFENIHVTSASKNIDKDSSLVLKAENMTQTSKWETILSPKSVSGMIRLSEQNLGINEVIRIDLIANDSEGNKIISATPVYVTINDQDSLIEKEARIYGFDDLLSLIKWMIEQQQSSLAKTWKLTTSQIAPESFPQYDSYARIALEEQIILRDKVSQANEEFNRDRKEFTEDKFWEWLKKAQDEMDQALVSLELKHWSNAIPHQEMSLTNLSMLFQRFQQKMESLRSSSHEVIFQKMESQYSLFAESQEHLDKIIQEQSLLNQQIQYFQGKFHEWSVEEYKQKIISLKDRQEVLIQETSKEIRTAPKQGLSRETLLKTIHSMQKQASILETATLPQRSKFEELPPPKEGELSLELLKKSRDFIAQDELYIIANNLYEMMEFISDYLHESTRLPKEHKIHEKLSSRLLLYSDILEVVLKRRKDNILINVLNQIREKMLYQYRSYSAGHRDYSELQEIIKEIAKAYRLSRGSKDYLLEIKLISNELYRQSNSFLSQLAANESNDLSFIKWLERLLKNQNRILEQIKAAGQNNPAIPKLQSAFYDLTDAYFKADEKNNPNLQPILKSIHQALYLNLSYIDNLLNRRIEEAPEINSINNETNNSPYNTEIQNYFDKIKDFL